MPRLNPAALYLLLPATFASATVARQGWKRLDQVDVRGAEGAWQLGWSGPKPAAPVQCAFVRLRRTLARDVKANAVRLVFQHEVGEFTAGDVGLLPLAKR